MRISGQRVAIVRVVRIGIISDTHGVLHERVPEVFAGVDQILHAGDVGGDEILQALREIAPVTSVPGNNDDGMGEEFARVTLDGLRIAITHILPRPHDLDARVTRELARRPADLVVFGHSHLPHDERVAGVWYFNPASSGPRRFDYPTSVGIIEKSNGEWIGRHIPLDDRSVKALETRMNQLSHSPRSS